MEDNIQFSYDLKISKDRVAVLIGKTGETKKTIESVTKTKINVDSVEGEVNISGDEPLGLYTAREIITAIGRGFNPEFAQLLLKQDYCIDFININDFAGNNKNTALRLKGRVIGQEGKARATVETLTDTHICVYGKTIGIIGETLRVSVARNAIEALLNGTKHASVYKSLEAKQKELRASELLGKEKEI